MYGRICAVVWFKARDCGAESNNCNKSVGWCVARPVSRVTEHPKPEPEYSVQANATYSVAASHRKNEIRVCK